MDDWLFHHQESISDFYWYYSGKDVMDEAGQRNFSTALAVAKQIFNSLTEYIQVNRIHFGMPRICFSSYHVIELVDILVFSQSRIQFGSLIKADYSIFTTEHCRIAPKTYFLRQGGYVFVSLFFCLSVSRITQKLPGRFS